MNDLSQVESQKGQGGVTDLDALYPPEAIAPWLKMSKRTLLNLARRKKIPCMRLNERVLRFHPRTILEGVK